jgi:hypothetical protein
MKSDSPIALVLIMLFLSACQEGYYIRYSPNQGIVPMESGKPMPTGTRTVSAQFSQINGDDELLHVSPSDDSDYTYRQNDKIIKPIGKRISIRASYQRSPGERIGAGFSYSTQQETGYNLTVFLENTRYWSLGDRGTYVSFYNILGASLINKQYYSVETQELNFISKSLMPEYYMSLLMYHKLSEGSGFRWGLASPLMINNPTYVRAGLTAGFVLRPSKTVHLHVTASRYSKAEIVSFDYVRVGDLRFIYPRFGSLTSRRLLNSPHSDVSIGLQYAF